MDELNPVPTTEPQCPTTGQTEAGPQTPPQTSANGAPDAPVEPLAVNLPPGPQPPPGGAGATVQPAPLATDEECWRRNRTRPQPSCPPHNPQPEPAPEPPPSPTTLRVKFAFKVTGGMDVVADVNSGFDLPLGLQPECIAATDASFGEVLNRILVQPLEIRVRSYLQRRFEEANSSLAEEAPVPFPGQPKGDDRRAMPTSVEEFLAAEAKSQTPPPATPIEDWPDDLDQTAKKAGFPNGISTRKSASKNGSPTPGK